MSAAGLHEVRELPRLAIEGGVQVAQCGQELVLEFERSADMDRGGYHVVAALAHVDVIVRVHFPPQLGTCEVRNHLVDIHVGTGARAGLEHVDGKLCIMLAVGDGARCCGDTRGYVCIEHAEVLVGTRGGFLYESEGADESAWHPEPAEREILHRALGLRSPERLGRYSQLAHAVALNPDFLFRHPANLGAFGRAATDAGKRKAVKAERSTCGMMLHPSTCAGHRHDLTRARGAFTSRWPLCRAARRAACTMQRSRIDSSARPRRGAVVAAAVHKFASAGPAESFRTHTRRSGTSRQGSREHRSRGGQGDREAHQSRRQGGRVLRARALAGRGSNAGATRVRALRLYLGGHKQSLLRPDAAGGAGAPAPARDVEARRAPACWRALTARPRARPRSGRNSRTSWRAWIGSRRAGPKCGSWASSTARWAISMRISPASRTSIGCAWAATWSSPWAWSGTRTRRRSSRMTGSPSTATRSRATTRS